jgi:hypothetical protein
VRYPGALRPRRSDLLLGTLDLMPTLVALMGLEVPSTCQGRNLAAASAPAWAAVLPNCRREMDPLLSLIAFASLPTLRTLGSGCPAGCA